MSPESLKRLRDWFTKNAVSLPWRPTDLHSLRDPYAVWISETMLQQTQVSTVCNYFIRWIKRFPDIETLAQAEESEVFVYWQGLGYYSRVRNLLKTAKKLCGNKMPEERKELEALPGIGSYTAGAILSLAYHKREAILDGNLVRIFSRLYEIDFLPTDKSHKTQKGLSASKIYWDYAQELANSPKAYMHNEAMMELGRTICKKNSPRCKDCPLVDECLAFKDNRTAEFPPTKKRTEKNWYGSILVIESSDEKILGVCGGQKFLDGQLSLLHFESIRGATAALPAKAEEFINADEIETIELYGSFRHNITVHKIECDVFYIKLKTSAKRTHLSSHELTRENKANNITFKWIDKSKIFETFANNFSLKALKICMKKPAQKRA